MFSFLDALATSEQIAEPRLALMEDFRNPRPGENALDIFEEEEQDSSQNVPLGIIDGVFLKCCQTTARPKRTKLLLMHLQKNESTGTLPALPLVSWFKETKISRHADTRCAGSFETVAMATTAETAKSLLSSIVVI